MPLAIWFIGSTPSVSAATGGAATKALWKSDRGEAYPFFSFSRLALKKHGNMIFLVLYAY